ncbi:MAG: hypothetical protein KA354_01005 [Phycisphaerae bacterium]|nr:hypothetical protein [Phycisphaerae bacterium]
MLDFDRIQTPPGDGDVLVEPVGESWLQLMEKNARAGPQLELQLAGIPIREARARVRAELGLDTTRLTIACGHQPAFVHPGVWAKHLAVSHFARSRGVAGIDFVVDNDAPPSPNVVVPGIGTDGRCTTHAIPFMGEAMAGAAYEGWPGLGPAELTVAGERLRSAMGHLYGQSLLGEYLEGWANHATNPNREPDDDLVTGHLAGRAQIDASFRANLPEHRVSHTFGGPFVADLLLNAERFAAAYNAALAEYRGRYGVRSPNRPLPDLARDGDQIETALWIYQLRQRRRRLWVIRRGDTIHLMAGQTCVGTVAERALQVNPDAALAELRPWLIRPRALALTLWIRLLACDLFIHGIGGAKYDRIADGIIRTYCQCEPPAYACVTATLRPPLPRQPASAGDLARARLHIRDLRFNPQRYLENAPADLLRQRESLIGQSTQVRLARGNRLTRRQVFSDIRTLNERLIASQPGLERNCQTRVEQLQLDLASNKVADNREFFYALQPPARLTWLAERVWEQAE